jgi:hypothetical protein
MNALLPLRTLVDGRRPLAAPEERCHLCGGALAAEHRHVIDRVGRALACACAACASLCEEPRGRWRALPGRVVTDPAFALDEAAWAELGVPVRLAFLFFNSSVGRWIALYPSPAGAVEATLDGQDPLAPLARASTLARVVQPDVEALLVRGRPRGGFQLMLVPIDACYRLVGRVRTHWQGLHGGDRAWAEIDAFFDELETQAQPEVA